MEHSLLAALEEPERAAVLSRARSRSVERGEIVVAEGEPADSLHLIVRGRMVVRTVRPDGSLFTINVLGRGDYFGELGLISPTARRTATVVALESSTTLVLGAADFRALRQRSRAPDRLMVALLARRVDELSRQLADAVGATVDERVVARLEQLASLFSDEADADHHVVLPVTQQEIADMVGATRQAVNPVLRDLAREGVLELNRGSVVVVDSAALRGRLESPR